MHKSVKCYTHFCVPSTGISTARTTLLLNAAPSSSMICASALCPLTISHLGESGIHLLQLYVSVFIFIVIETLRTLCHASSTTCFCHFDHHKVDFTTYMETNCIKSPTRCTFSCDLFQNLHSTCFEWTHRSSSAVSISPYMQLLVHIMLIVNTSKAEQLVTVSMICTNSCIYSDM